MKLSLTLVCAAFVWVASGAPIEEPLEETPEQKYYDIWSLWDDVKQGVKDSYWQAHDSLEKPVNDAIQKTKKVGEDAVHDAKQKLEQPLKNAWQKAQKAGEDTLQSAKDSLLKPAEGVIKNAKKWASDTYENAEDELENVKIKNALGKVEELGGEARQSAVDEFGKPVGDLLQNGKDWRKQTNEKLEDLKQTADDVGDQVEQVGSETVNDLHDHLDQTGHDLWNTIEKTGEDAFEDLQNKWHGSDDDGETPEEEPHKDE